MDAPSSKILFLTFQVPQINYFLIVFFNLLKCPSPSCWKATPHKLLRLSK